MTYEQSLKNIELLKSFGSPLDDCFLFFHFQNNTEFIPMFIFRDYESLIYKNYEEQRAEVFRNKLPFAWVGLDKNYDLRLDYIDVNMCYTHNLTKNILLNHDLIEFPRGYKGIKNDFLNLLKLLKNK